MSRIAATATVALLAAAGLAVVAQTTPADARPVQAAGVASSSRYTAIAPQRLLDTRKASDPHHGAVRPGATLALKVSGTSAVPASATAVVLNVTVVKPTAGGHITVFPYGTRAPTASNLNFGKGQTVANSVIVKIGTRNAVDLENASRGSSNLLADVSGYFGAALTNTPGGFTATTPTRLLDTRNGTGARKGAVGAERSVGFTAAGVNGIPSDASAVVLNVAAYRPTRGGHVTAYPSGSAVPTASNLNFTAGQTVPNLAIVPIGDHRMVSLFNGSHGPTQLFADVFGYFSAGSPQVPGALGALSPKRLLDTRYGVGAPKRAVRPNGTVTLAVTGNGGVPLRGVSAVVLNVTATDPTRGGHLTVYPSGAVPTISTVNFTAGQTVPNLVVARLSTGGLVRIKNESSGSLNLLADVAGYVLNTTRSVPSTTTSRYVSDLSTISQTGNSSEGCYDGASATGLVLLDVGAQTTTYLGGATGVSLVGHGSSPVRVTDAELVAALNTYVSEFLRCKTAGGTSTIAIGTNNDGAFDPKAPHYFAAGARGKDWADNVIDAMAPRNTITFAGANDIESNFASTESQAETWETYFLKYTSAALINNGSLANCPDTFGATTQCGAVTDGNGVRKTWTRANYVALSYGLSPGRISVLPQIYYANHPNQVAQWINLDLSAHKHLTFEGSLTQSGISACGSGCGYTGNEGYTALYNGLSSIIATPSLSVATNLQSS